MKRVFLLVVGACFLASMVSAQDASVLKTDKEKKSYSVGMNIGTGIKKQALDIDADMLVRGIKDALSGAKPLLTDDQITQALGALQQDMVAKQTAIADKNKKDGAAFLAANKTKPGVVTLPSGLQYKILKPGTGPKPTANDTVTTQYKGTLLDGTVFDSTYDRNEPATFKVSGVISGWTEALQLMPVGSKWQLWIPSDLAYGERGYPGGVISPNETLVFEVELIKIEEAKK